MSPSFPRAALALAFCFLITAACAIQQPAQDSADSDEETTGALSSAPANPGATEYPPVGARLDGLGARPDDVAVVVGIEKYAFLPNVAGARESAYDWEDFFRDTLQMERVYTLIDEDADNVELEAHLERARSEVSANGRLWFVFVGHGAPGSDADDGLLVGMDARQSLASLESRSLRRSEVINELSRAPTDDVVVVLDTCFSGQTPDGDQLIEGAQPVMPSSTPREAPSSALILSAARGDQLAGPLPGAERPSYSYLLLGALRGWAVDGQGDVSAGEAHRYVERQLRNVSSRRQSPQLQGPADRVLVRNTVEPAPEIRDLLAGRQVEPVEEREQTQEPEYTSQGNAGEMPATPQPPAERPRKEQLTNVGHDLLVHLGDEWVLNDRRNPDSGTHLWDFHGRHGVIVVQLKQGYGSLIDTFVTTAEERVRREDSAVVLHRDDHFQVGENSGYFRLFEYPDFADGVAAHVFSFYTTDGDDLWLFSGRVPVGHPDFDAWTEDYLNFVSAIRLAD